MRPFLYGRKISLSDKRLNEKSLHFIATDIPLSLTPDMVFKTNNYLRKLH